MAPSSSGQDTGLSRREQGFESPRGHHTTPEKRFRSLSGQLTCCAKKSVGSFDKVLVRHVLTARNSTEINEEERMKRALLCVAFFAVIFSVPTQAYAAQLCPDGSYVAYAPCHLCPDGSYVGGGRGCRMTPRGTYVPDRGPAQMAPDGSYVPGGGNVRACPDGSYVTGRCFLAPDGTYVGK